MPLYKIIIKPSVGKEIRGLPTNLVKRIIAAIENLFSDRRLNNDLIESHRLSAFS